MGNTSYTAINGSPQFGKEIEKGVEKVVDTAEHIGAEIKDELQHLGEFAKKTGTAALQQVGGAAEKAYSQVVSTGKAGADRMEREIKQYPLTSVLVAFGAGAVLGMFTRR